MKTTVRLHAADVSPHRRPSILQTTRSPRSDQAGLLGIVKANSSMHWALLLLGLAGSLLFNLTWLAAGFVRPGYNWVAQPMSALSLGPGGWVQG